MIYLQLYAPQYAVSSTIKFFMFNDTIFFINFLKCKTHRTDVVLVGYSIFACCKDLHIYLSRYLLRNLNIGCKLDSSPSEG